MKSYQKSYNLYVLEEYLTLCKMYSRWTDGLTRGNGKFSVFFVHFDLRPKNSAGKNRQELVQFFSFDTFIVWDSRQLLSTTCDQNTIASVLYGYPYDAKDCLLEGWCNRIHYASAGISHGFSQYLNIILQTKLAGILYSLLLFIGMRKSRQFFVALIFVLFALDVPDHQ